MRKLIACMVLAFATLAPGAVRAQFEGTPTVSESGGARRGLGVGVQRTLGGIAGPAVAWDGGKFHIEGVLGVGSINRDDPQDDLTVLGFGARFYYHLHTAGRADFSVGGGVGYVSVDEGAFDASTMELEGSAQIRAFVVDNVCLSASLGLLIASANDALLLPGDIGMGEDGDSAFALRGDLIGSFGLYYFF